MWVDFQITKKDIKVVSPYLPELPAKARQLGGVWDGACWVYPLAVLRAVRRLYLSLYGEDGTPQAYYDVEVEYYGNVGEGKRQFFDLGRLIFSRYRRDAAVRTGDFVTLLDGGFYPSGGSAKYPSIGVALTPTLICFVRRVPEYVVKNWSLFSVGKLLKAEVGAVSQTELILNQIAVLVYQLPPEVAAPFLPLLPQYQESFSLYANTLVKTLTEGLALLQSLVSSIDSGSVRLVVHPGKGVEGGMEAFHPVAKRLALAYGRDEVVALEFRKQDPFIDVEIHRSGESAFTVRLVP